jgi:Subtilase family
VISESYGFSQRPGRYAVFYAADDAAVAAGVTVVVSSGDSGDSGTVSSPATDPNVIAAGATNTLRLLAQAYGYTNWTNNNITPLSSGGTTPNNKLVDLVAPGYGGEAECNPAGSGCPANTTTEAFGGTSEAAPLIAGAAADVIEAYAAAHGGTKPTPAQVKAILTSTAEDVDAPADQQGAGLVDIYAAVRAAQQLPGAKSGGQNEPASLIASPTQIDVTATGGTLSNQQVTLYNTGATKTRVVGAYRSLTPVIPIGKTVTEPVSAPDPSLPVPAAGAQAAKSITFQVPPGLSRLDADMIVPDPANGTILSYTLIAPQNNLAQISYDYGTPSTRAGALGTTPNIQHAEVADPAPGTWTAKILWANGRAHLQSLPNVPGTFSGNISFRLSGQEFLTLPAIAPVTIGAHSSATVPLRIVMPLTPGDHPESVQFASDNGATTSLPVARRTLIASAGGHFDTTITSTVGRGVGQISTYDINVPAGEKDIDVAFSTPDASADNKYTYWLINPSGTVVAEDATPTTTVVGSTTPTALADLIALSPVAGTWEIDVELTLTVSGLEFRQVVEGAVTYNQLKVTEAGLPSDPSTTLAAGTSDPVTVTIKNTANVGRTFTVKSSAGDVTGITPVYIPAGQTGAVTFSSTPVAAPGTVVTGTLTVLSNTSATNQTDTFAALPYTYTAG